VAGLTVFGTQSQRKDARDWFRTAPASEFDRSVKTLCGPSANGARIDVQLPDLSGFEVCRQIKNDSAPAAVFLILISGAAISASEKAVGLQSGADEYLNKTVEMQEFRARVRTMMRLRGTTAALRASEHYREAEHELRNLPGRIMAAQEAERLRVARELHDGVNQLIALARMRLRKVEESVTVTDPAVREILRRCHQLLVQVLEENRRIAYNFHPNAQDELGLTALVSGAGGADQHARAGTSRRRHLGNRIRAITRHHNHRSCALRSACFMM